MAPKSLQTNGNGLYQPQRLAQVLVASALAAAVVGFFAGVSAPARPVDKPRPAAPALTVRKAPSYKELRATGPKPLPDGPSELRRHEVRLAADTTTTVDPRLDRRDQAIAEREALRAYAGAPPVVPHPIPQGGGLACTACHSDGLFLGAKAVPLISHKHLTNCTQCHAAGEGNLPKEIALLPQSVGDSEFVGLRGPSKGERAWPGAPPTVPHSTFMRENCASCHGDGARLGLHSSHPWRASCTQCHAPSAVLDQAPGALAAQLPAPIRGLPGL